MDANQFFERFDAEVSNEEAAIEIVFNALLETGLHCRRCGGTKFGPREETRRVRCITCKRLLPFTADTFFHRAKFVRASLAAVFMLDCGIQLSDLKFSRRLNISQAAVWEIMRSIGTVLAETCDEGVRVPTQFLHVVAKRSRLTSAGKHPCAEDPIDGSVRLAVDNGAMSLEQRIANGECSDLQQLQVVHALREGIVHFDQLSERTMIDTGPLSASLVMLELDGFVDRLPGEYYRLKTSPKRKAVSDVAAVLPAIKGVHGSVSKKYLSLYVAVSEYVNAVRVQRGHSDCASVNSIIHVDAGSLLMRCIRYGPVSMTKVTGRRKSPPIQHGRRSLLPL